MQPIAHFLLLAALALQSTEGCVLRSATESSVKPPGELDYAAATEDRSGANMTTEASFTTEDPSFSIDVPYVQLVCPSWNPDHFISASWYARTADSKLQGLFFGIGGVVWPVHQSIGNLTYKIPQSDTLTIVDHDCNHNGTYVCVRQAKLGFRSEEHSFRVTQCQAVKIPGQRRSENLKDDKAVGNGSTRLTSAGVLLLAVSQALLVPSY